MTRQSRRLRAMLASGALGPALLLLPWLLQLSSVTCFYPSLLHWLALSLMCICLLSLGAITVGCVQKATTFLLLGGIGFAAPTGAAFLMFGSETLYCRFPDVKDEAFALLNASLVLIAVLVFFRHLRPRMQEFFRINTRALDFSRMEFHALGPFVRPDRKEPLSMSVLISLGLLGIPLATLRAGSLEGVLTVVVCWFLGFVFLGYLLIGNIYQAWLIQMKSRGVGKVMVVYELV